MSYQKRKRKRYQRRKQKALPKYACLMPSNLDDKASEDLGRRLEKFIFPPDRKFQYIFSVFDDEERIKSILRYEPVVIVLAGRFQDIADMVKFFTFLQAAKSEHPGYKPEVKIWEVESPPGEIPPIFPEIQPTFFCKNAVLADFLINRTGRNLLN